jgi:hypothetical protein
MMGLRSVCLLAVYSVSTYQHLTKDCHIVNEIGPKSSSLSTQIGQKAVLDYAGTFFLILCKTPCVHLDSISSGSALQDRSSRFQGHRDEEGRGRN